MRIAVSLICALCLNLTAWCQHDTGHWKTLAEGMSKALISNFWGASFADHPNRFYFNYLSQQADLKHEQYWPQAHAMDVMVPICALATSVIATSTRFGGKELPTTTSLRASMTTTIGGTPTLTIWNG